MTVDSQIQLFQAADGQVEDASVVRKFRITAADGKTYETNRYNFDVAISVGYRVKSLRSVQFRICE